MSEKTSTNNTRRRILLSGMVNRQRTAFQNNPER